MSRYRYSVASKIEAVRRVVDDGRRVGDVARELGVSGDSLFFWVRRYREMSAAARARGAGRAGPAAPLAAPDGAPDVGSLVAYLRKTRVR